MVMFAAGAKCFEDFYEAYIVAIDVAIKAGVQFAPSPNHEPQEKKELMHIHLHPTFDIKLDNQPTGPVNVHVVSMPGRAAETQVVRDDEGNIISSTQIERDLTSGGSCLKGVAA